MAEATDEELDALWESLDAKQREYVGREQFNVNGRPDWLSDMRDKGLVCKEQLFGSWWASQLGVDLKRHAGNDSSS